MRSQSLMGVSTSEFILVSCTAEQNLAVRCGLHSLMGGTLSLGSCIAMQWETAACASQTHQLL